MAALRDASEDELCSPPGLFGWTKVRWIRRGLKTGALTIHHSGQGLSMTMEAIGGDPRQLTLTRAARDWEYAQRMEDEGSPASNKRSPVALFGAIITERAEQLRLG